MSFLKSAAGAGGVTGLGASLGLNPTSLQTLGTAMNGIASVGGASPGYAGQQGDPGLNNHLQMLDPEVLRAILAKFHSGGPTTGVYQ